MSVSAAPEPEPREASGRRRRAASPATACSCSSRPLPSRSHATSRRSPSSSSPATCSWSTRRGHSPPRCPRAAPAARPAAAPLDARPPRAPRRWVVELRRATGRGAAAAGERLPLPAGARPSCSPLPRNAALGRVIHLAGRDCSTTWSTTGGRSATATRRAMAARAYQTVFATEPGSAEMPSAGRPFTPEMVTRLVARGIDLAPLVLHTGVSSLESDEAPYPERFRVPACDRGAGEPRANAGRKRRSPSARPRARAGVGGRRGRPGARGRRLDRARGRAGAPTARDRRHPDRLPRPQLLPPAAAGGYRRPGAARTRLPRARGPATCATSSATCCCVLPRLRLSGCAAACASSAAPDRLGLLAVRGPEQRSALAVPSSGEARRRGAAVASARAPPRRSPRPGRGRRATCR